jgi:predicted porin
MEIYRMKKSLLALAALSAIAGAAQAQSSVTVYGILDVGYVGSNTTSSAPTGVSKATGSQFGESAEQTSRLGLKGTEDLGNGTQALFTAEFYLYPQDTTLSGNGNSGLLNRQTFVGLHKNGVGQAALGLQYTPVFNAAAATDPGQLNNIMGNVVYVSQTGGASNAATTAEGTNAGFTVRTANTLTLQSDAFAGFRVDAMASLNNVNKTQTGPTTGGNNNASGWGIGADYTWNKLFVTAQYQSLKQLTTGGTVAQAWNNAGPGSIAISAEGATVPTTNGLNVTDNQGYVAATYDFGILKAYAQYVTRTGTATFNSADYLKRTAEQIGVRSFITPKVEAWASAGVGRYQSMGVTEPTANFNAWQLGSNYWLSKRTNLYAIYGQTITSNYAIASGSAAGTYAQSGSNYAIGIRHTF